MSPTQIGPAGRATGGMEPFTAQVHLQVHRWRPLSVCPTVARRAKATKRSDFDSITVEADVGSDCHRSVVCTCAPCVLPSLARRFAFGIANKNMLPYINPLDHPRCRIGALTSCYLRVSELGPCMMYGVRAMSKRVLEVFAFANKYGVYDCSRETTTEIRVGDVTIGGVPLCACSVSTY